jgi:ADP-ribose pyrophosphatase YjhB (NUDIX family)
MTIPKWLEWARRLESIAQSGLTYTTSPFDVERFEAVRDLAAEIVSEYTHVDLHEILEIYHQQSGYTTPKVDVRGVVFRDGQVLLVQELADGGWTLPGGWVDVNEAPTQAVEREVWEETGYEVKAHKLLALYDREGHDHPPYLFHAYKLFFRCELTGGAPRPSLETGEARFFPPDGLPPLSLARTSHAELERFFEHLRCPDLPTDFD